MRNAHQAVVVCGRNEGLKEAVETLVADRAAGDRYRVLGFTTDLPSLMQVATLFVGKPGGLTSAECMAVGLPMVLIEPIPGQEERNSDYLLEAGAAVRCNYETTVGYKIDLLLGEPARVASMAANARRLGRTDAAQVIARTVLADEPAPLWISRAAQRVIRAAAREGVSARGGEPDNRVATLRSATTGRSLALVTGQQLQRLTGKAAAVGSTLTVARSTFPSVRSPDDLDLRSTLRRLLATESRVTLTTTTE
jgi:processive 1,2-diacylglycerol beta-glucosyltransferase